MWCVVLLTVYVKKEEEKVYHAVMLDTLTAHDFKMEVHTKNVVRSIRVFQQLAKKYDIPVDMISGLYKKTKKG